MKRRDFCKALALSAAALAVPRAAAENTQGAVGRAVADGRYSMRFRSELSLTDVPHDYYYSDSFFAHSALEYDHSLALASLGLVGAAFNTAASDARYWANGEAGREANLADAFATLGFADPVFYHYDIDVGQAGDFVGHSLARKTITLNGQRTTIVAVILRGGGYGGGAAAGSNGNDGLANGSGDAYIGSSSAFATVTAARGGAGADATPPAKESRYGCGGTSGHGGGGAGSNGTAEAHQTTSENISVSPASLTASDTQPAPGGRGSDGGEAGDGCIIIYYRKKKELQPGPLVTSNNLGLLDSLGRRMIV